MVDNILKWVSIIILGWFVGAWMVNAILELSDGNTSTKVLGIAGGFSAVAGALWVPVWSKVFSPRGGTNE